MINQTFEILNLQQRKIQTPLFRNAREALKSKSSHEKYHAKYLVVDSIQRLPQKIFMQSNICPVFIYSNKSYIFQEGISLFQYFFSKKDNDVVFCEEQLWKLLQQITKALILLREAGYEHRHIKQYAIRRINPDNYKLVFHPTMVTPQEHIQQRNYNWYNFYLTPEQLQNFSHEEATTCVFSFGCMLLNLMNPWDFKRDIYSRSQYSINNKIVEEKLENASRWYSKKIVDIVKKMLIQKHEQRITLHELFTLIQKYSPFGKKVEMASSLKNIVSSRIAKSKEKINSPSQQSLTQKKHVSFTKQRNHVERSPVITFQRGTFGGHREDSSNEKEKKEYQQNQTLHTKQSLINSRAKELEFKEEQSLQDCTKRSYSQYFEETKAKKWNKKEKSAKHSLAKEVREVSEVGEQLKVTHQKGKIKVDININETQDDPIGYNEYIIKTADKKKIKVGLSRQETNNDRQEQLSKVESSADKNQFIPNPTKFKENQSHNDSNSIEHSVNLFKSKLDNYHLKLAECLQQPLSIAKKLGYQGVWINGNVYYGQFKNGRRNGLALQIFENKEYYYGHYRDDMFHGQGFYYWNANEHFLGVFEAGCKKEGTWWGKNKYTGEIKDNMRHGIGSYFYANGKIYEGEWFMGKRHGSGIIIEPSGQKFIGTFKTGNKWGQGTYLLEGCRVIGIWDGENAVDKVEIMYQNGRLYKGFINEYFEMHGKGELKFSNGSICRGNFQNGDFVFGEMVYQNGERYVGEIKDFRRHGRGTYSYNDGRQVTAQWANNKNVGVIKD